jgi:hypothetical protein
MKFIQFIKKSMPACIVTILCLMGIVIVLSFPSQVKEIEFPLGLGIIVVGGISMLALYAYLEHRFKRKAQ